jgi:tetratricopeptide (TPR) repeat protein
MLSLQKLFLAAILIVRTSCCVAQESWPSPEVEQMYRHAGEYMTLHNYQDAAITYKHAISLAPGHMVLYRDLANALYLSGRYKEAVEVLSSVNSMPDADARCYYLLAASQAAQADNKDALLSLKNGLAKFPSSGLLYYEKGTVLAQYKNAGDALLAWLDGIEKDAAYPDNYYEAAKIYLGSHKVMWGLLYGEIYVNIADDTARQDEIKKRLFTAWKTLFDNVDAGLPRYDDAKHQTADNFIDAVTDVYASLTPVVSDGITTENLTMVRTRFLMEWFRSYHLKYPFALFSYLDELVHTGHFDIYNESLFGRVESADEFKAWSTFHEGDLGRFATWQKQHLFVPSSSDFYNKKDFKNISYEIK